MLFQVHIKELKVTVSGFKSDQGKANISFYNKELYELSIDYFWQNKLPEQIKQAAFDKLIYNNNFLKDEEISPTSYFENLYKLSLLYSK